ncbi:MAG: twin-arginine translocation signal domain-containing protein [Anaerolineae bacterium]
MLSRRQFLQAAGIAVAAQALPRLPSATPTFEPLYGRSLETLPIYAARTHYRRSSCTCGATRLCRSSA